MGRTSLLRSLAMLLTVVAVIGLGQVAVSAQTQVQELLLPFSAGVVEVQADETYSGEDDHPALGAIAFDLTDVRKGDSTPVLAIGDGRVRVECVHSSGSAVLQFQADGYDGDFYYVHLDGSRLRAGISDAWSRIERGQVIGRLYPNPLNSGPEEPCAQFSTGPHLHLDFPRIGMEIDGVIFNEFGPNDRDQISSTNRRPGERSTATCSGEAATIVGTSRDDVLQGTEGRDVIAGLKGSDLIFGLEGDDIICGGRGHDILVGGDGVDVILGGNGDDTIVAANGSTDGRRDDPVGGGIFDGGSGDDVIFGSNRQDRIRGGPGDDALSGFDGQDWVRGGKGEDFLDGGKNGDDLHGGDGADLIVTGAGDTVVGGASTQDVCEFSDRPTSIRSCESRVSP